MTIVGRQCWFCGYDKTFTNLCFHHVERENKNFGLTTRELIGYAWKRVIAEMRKCILICHNCHGEIHENIISFNKVAETWKNRWEKIS